MHSFASLLDKLSFTYSNNKKMELLKIFFSNTPDPERGYAIGVIAGTIKFPTFKRTLVKELIQEQIEPYLFSLSYDYVGDMSETVALLWKNNGSTASLPSLTEIIQQFNTLPKSKIKNYLRQLLNEANVIERWALLKLGSDSLRIGVSARFIKQSLAQLGNRTIEEIEHIWHGMQPPYIELFEWLENGGAKPDVTNHLFFHPVMLAQPLDNKELVRIEPELFAVERKIDGIRIQLTHTSQGKALFTRTGDEVSTAFPEIAQLAFLAPVVLDGELVIKKSQVGSFNDLQQRLNRKNPSAKLIQNAPAHIILYDILFLENQDLRALPFTDRRYLLEQWYRKNKSDSISLSEILPFHSSTELLELKQSVLASQDIAVEGLMIKRKASLYIAGRPSGQWYKWKKEPYVIDAVLMYAQRGQGKRSSFYSDYTFGLWEKEQLLPIGKAYFGFTDEELKQLDKWIRNHTLKRYGPVCEVERGLVFEVAFDRVSRSTRHKSGFALRFPRIKRIRWDKPVDEANQLTDLSQYLND